MLCIFNYIGFNVSFAIVYAALLTRTNRIFRIFYAGKRTKVMPSLTSPISQVFIAFVLIGIQVSICYSTNGLTLMLMLIISRILLRIIINNNIYNSTIHCWSAKVTFMNMTVISSYCNYHIRRNKHPPPNKRPPPFVDFSWLFWCVPPILLLKYTDWLVH